MVLVIGGFLAFLLADSVFACAVAVPVAVLSSRLVPAAFRVLVGAISLSVSLFTSLGFAVAPFRE